MLIMYGRYSRALSHIRVWPTTRVSINKPNIIAQRNEDNLDAFCFFEGKCANSTNASICIVSSATGTGFTSARMQLVQVRSLSTSNKGADIDVNDKVLSYMSRFAAMTPIQ